MQFPVSIVVVALLCFASVRGQDGCNPVSGAEASRRFAYELYFKALQNAAPDSNFILAPKIVGSALTMLVAGAGDETKQQIWRGLELDSTSRRFVESDYPCLLRMYEKPSGNDTSVGAYEPLMASRLFGEKTIRFAKSYLRTTGSYGPKLKRLDFSGNPIASRKRINSWVTKNTGKNIRRLFSKEEITSDTTLALASAAYFKGLWKYPFNLESKLRRFKINDTNVVETQFMKVNGDFRIYYSTDLGGRITELPYEVNGDSDSLCMLLLSSPYSIERIEQKLTEETLAPVMSRLFGLYGSNVDIYFPKFKISSKRNLKPMLQSIGITDVFNPTAANFSGMIAPNSKDEGKLFADAAIQEATLEVDEKGGTARSWGGRWSSGTLPPSMIFDKPFIVMLYDKPSQSILFIGKVNDPSAE